MLNIKLFNILTEVGSITDAGGWKWTESGQAAAGHLSLGGQQGPPSGLLLPEPIPLSTAPSLTPEALLVLLVGALWGARLGRNRHLQRDPKNQPFSPPGQTSLNLAAIQRCVQGLFLKGRRSSDTSLMPSSEVSNSTKAGVTAEPCRRMSWGVVMDTRHLTRVRGTVLPSAERTRLRLMRYWPLSSAGVAKTLSGPKPSMDMNNTAFFQAAR
ncbi:hypothetical protein EYF80_042678 [Liparis tanakae]|uniref:Uncharacterized protein n=1 Tax=Liparis tanakae TaxID=230148 RepID=A0A4Z2G3J5_9TELE|nr:hypothetical protein EYF80_042678 [Liparis tanakae]